MTSFQSRIFRMILFFLLILFSQKVIYAKILQLNIYLFSDYAIIDLYLQTSSGKVIVPSLVDPEYAIYTKCIVKRITSSVPYQLINQSYLRLFSVNQSAILLIRYYCYPTTSKFFILKINLRPIKENDTITVFIYNQTPFSIDVKHQISYLKSFDAYVIDSAPPEFEIVVRRASNNYNYIIIEVLLGASISILLTVVYFWLKKYIAIKDTLVNLYQLLDNETEKRIITLLVKYNGKLYQHQIVKELKLNKSTASKALKRLESKGLVKRTKTPEGVLVELLWKPQG
jgi:uncharacterized membrane protein